MTMGLERLSPLDITNLAFEGADAPMHVGALALLEPGPLVDDAGGLRLDEIRSRLALRTHRAPGLRRVVYRPGPLHGRPLWVDAPHFAIEHHVHAMSVPAPGGEQELLAVTEELMAPLLDRSRPLWQIWFLTGLADGRVAMLVKLHHAMADGLAAVTMMSLLFDLSADAADPVPMPWTPQPRPSGLELLADNLATKWAAMVRMAHSFRHPLAHARGLAAAARAASRTVAAGWGTPRTSLNAPVGPRRRLAVVRLRLDVVKEVAHAHGAKVNDVVLDLAAGGVRQLLLSRGEGVEGLEVRVSIAVARRASESAAMGNQVGGILVRVPLGEPSGRARLDEIARASAREKQAQQAGLVGQSMVWLAESGLARRYFRRQRLTNLFETSLPGPPVPVYVLGARILDLTAMTLTSGNVALAFAALSYAGDLNVSVTADADRCPDLPTLLAGMEDAWAELAGEARPARSARRATG